MNNLRNGIVFLALAFILEIPHILLRLLGVITIIQDKDFVFNAIAILSIIGIIFYIVGVLCLLRFLFWMKKQPTV
jgi:hypothetical protein